MRRTIACVVTFLGMGLFSPVAPAVPAFARKIQASPVPPVTKSGRG